MLYVFHVDVGRMLNFDMTVALSSVENLKATIERLHGIPASNIVLLVSGGEMLAHSTQVSYYSAGTDTNPIYMFLTGDVKMPMQTTIVETDLDIREQVERSLELPAVYDTVVKRAQIALRMHDLARDEDRLCERLVHEQHLQQQGWSAVVANLEDLTEEFRSRFQNFCQAFDRHLELRSSYLELLKNFSDDLNKLSRIPILPGLMPLAEADFHGFDELLENDDVFSRSAIEQQTILMAGANAAATTKGGIQNTGAAVTESEGLDNIDEKSTSTSTSPNKKLKMAIESNEGRSSQNSQTSITSNSPHRLNLLQWITSKENHKALKIMSEECIQGLSTFNENIYEQMKLEVEGIIELAEKCDVKEIRGLGDRLCKLEEFKYKIKNMVKDQKELSTAFQQNQNRAINLRDASILPDLCASHQSQLLVMLQNHKKIREHRQCITKAKDELGANLHTRLTRIVYIENSMSEFDNRLLFYHRCLRRAESHINIIEQIHQAPNMYMAAVTEVVRRKFFSTEFHLWASKLSEDFDSIHREEMKRRQQFNSNFEGHFLNILFPGMADMPPSFANENPLLFDNHLPNITTSDIDVLTTQLPEMASQIQLPDMEPVIYFFVSRSGTHQQERFEDLLKQKQNRAAEELKKTSGEDQQSSSSNKAMEVSGTKLSNPRLRKLLEDASGPMTGGEESETDTETEFEKVPPNDQQTTTCKDLQLISTNTQSTATDQPITQSVETLTDETSETLKNEVTHMRVMLSAMSKLAMECIKLARSNLHTLRDEAVTKREDLQSDLQTLNDKCNLLKMQSVAREQELGIQQAKREQEIIQLSEELKKRDYELKEEKEQTREQFSMKAKCAALEAQLDELKDTLKSLDLQKEQAVIETRDKLIHEHKTLFQSLRQRFKLTTSMERSLSDLSLETNPLNENCIEKELHDTILSQLRIELEAEKERAVTAAIEMERSLWQSKIVPLNSESVMANVGILKEMLEERERQMEQLREKDLLLTKENYQLKTRLDALTNEEGNSWLKEKIDYLNKDKCRLEEELNQEKSRRLEMETSFALLKCSTYEPSPFSRSKLSGSSHKFIVLESCSKGDLVLVVWSMRHGHFMVVQDSPTLYFVHSDSLPALNLHVPQIGDDTIIPTPYYAIGRVLDKEYCQARKDGNRFRVTKGSKFYRIKLTSFVSKQLLRRVRLESLTSSISRSASVSQCDPHSEAWQTSSAATAELSNTIVSEGTSPSLSAITTTSSCIDSLPKDIVDAAVVATTANQTTTTAAIPTAAMLAFRERNINIIHTSITEEDEEIFSAVMGDKAATASATQTNVVQTKQPQQQQQQTTVITEQPTASASKLELDLMLASAKINTATTAVAETIDDESDNLQTSCMASGGESELVVSTTTAQTSLSTDAMLTSFNQEMTGKSSPTIPTSIGTASEDSDEYRSLELKDEHDFPISE